MTRTKGIVLLVVFLLFSIGLGTWGVFGLLGKIQDGRRAGTTITCAMLSAVSESGRESIISGAQGPDTRFTRNLERMGYPPLAVRRRQANKAALAYVDGIATRIEVSLHRKNVSLVNANGTFDCQTFRRLANVSP